MILPHPEQSELASNYRLKLESGWDNDWTRNSSNPIDHVRPESSAHNEHHHIDDCGEMEITILISQPSSLQQPNV
jgi:hypothetical protein